MTPNENNQDETESQIQKLVITIQRLMSLCRNGWVPWERISREITGTDNYREIYYGYAQLPEWRHLFFMDQNGHVVKLTEVGIRYAQDNEVEELSEIEQITNGIRRYAARLRDTYIKVEHIFQVAIVGNKYVHALEVGLTEDSFPSETPVTFCPQQGGAHTQGKIVGQESDGGILYVLFPNQLLEAFHLPAQLRIDRGFLLSLTMSH